MLTVVEIVRQVLIMIRELLFSRPSIGACAATLVLAAALSPMFADAATGNASATADNADSRYQRERANCVAGRTQQDPKACLREAVAARDAARKGLLTTETPQALRDNAVQRCQAQPDGAERAACERMVQGGGTVSGSVGAGGELREITTVVPPKSQMKKAQDADRAASAP